jgi:hypothetical protein
MSHCPFLFKTYIFGDYILFPFSGGTYSVKTQATELVGRLMSRNTINVLIYHLHKRVNLIYGNSSSSSIKGGGIKLPAERIAASYDGLCSIWLGTSPILLTSDKGQHNIRSTYKRLVTL